MVTISRLGQSPVGIPRAQLQCQCSSMFFVKGLYVEVKCTSRKDCLDGREALQRDLDRLESWAVTILRSGRNLTVQCIVLSRYSLLRRWAHGGSLVQMCVPNTLSFQVKYNYNMLIDHFLRRSIHIHSIFESSRLYSNCPLRRRITAPGWCLEVFCLYIISFSSLPHLPISYLRSAAHAQFVLSHCKTENSAGSLS